MRFGTFHLIGTPDMAPAARRFGETLEQIALADELGFDYVWNAEHHFSNYGLNVNPLLVIAKASALAPRVRFGQSVLVTPFWNPVRLAEDLATTDILTGGRLDIGLGRGYQGMEFRGLNLDMNQSRDMFVENLEVMKRAWTEDDFTFIGRYYQVPSPITVLPRPVQDPHPPIWIAAQSTTSVDWAAEHGYWIMMTGGGSFEREQLQEWSDRYRERWSRAGHPEADLRIGLLRFVFVADSDDQARSAVWPTRWQRRLAEHLRLGDERITAGFNDPYPFDGELDDDAWWDRLVFGTPDRCIAQLRKDVDMGVTDALGWFDVGGLASDQVTTSMRLFVREVMPALAEAAVASRSR